MAAKEKKSKFDINFASNPEIAQKILGFCSQKVSAVRTDRRNLEDTWLRFFNMWNVTKDESHQYNGRAQLYVPEVRKNVESQARQLTKAAFPGADCFDVDFGKTGTRKGAEAWRAYMKWAMENNNLQLQYFIAMRQSCLLGTSPIFLPWRKTVRQQFRSRREGKLIKPTKQEVTLFDGPDFVPRDLFRWYTMNPKKQDLSDGCFEINPISYFQLKRLEKAGELENIAEILSGNSAYAMEEFSNDVLRAESQGINIQFSDASVGEAIIRKDKDDPSHTIYEEVILHLDMILPEACEDDEDPDLPIPMQIKMYGNAAIGMARRNPFYHQSPPYVVGRYIQPNVDEAYGQGIPWAIQYMQYEMNSKAEQGMDAGTLALNPVAAIDPGLAGGSNEFNIEPGAIWWANPAGIKLMSLPDTSPIAYQAIQHLKGLMQDYSDRSPALPPQLQGKSRSATQSEIVADAMSVDNWLFQMCNEQSILIPMLQQWEALTDQNMSDDLLITVLGKSADDLKRTLVSKQVMLGMYAYRWKGALNVANKQITARQMLDFLKVMSMMPQAVPKFNAPEFIRVLYTDMWQLPEPQKILGLEGEDTSQDPIAENKMVEMGLEIEVWPTDDDAEHMKLHDEGLRGIKDKASQMLMMTHILNHKKQAEIKQAQQQAQQQMQQVQMMMAQQQGAQGGGSKPGSGNRTQMSPNASGGDMASGQRA